MTLNIMNPKQLEKQVKLVETRIAELETEIAGLEKIRAACQILLGNEVEFPTKAPEPLVAEVKVAKPKAPKAAKVAETVGEASENLSGKIVDLLRKRTEGMTADEIYDELKGQGVELGGKPVQTVYTTLEKHPDLFHEAENGQWRKQDGSGVTAH